MSLEELDELHADIIWAPLNLFGHIFDYSVKQMRAHEKKNQDTQQVDLPGDSDE